MRAVVMKKAHRAASRDEYAGDRPAHIDRDVEPTDFKSPGTVRAHSRTAPGGKPVFVSMYSRKFQVAPHHADAVRQHFDKIQQAHEAGDEGFHFEHDYDDADKGKVPLHIVGNYDADGDKPTNVIALHRDNGTIFQPHPDDKDFHGEIAQVASDEYHGISGYKRNTAMKSHDHAAAASYHGRLAKALREHGEIELMNQELAKARQHNQLATERK